MPDGRGLSLVIHPSGKASWVLRFRSPKKRNAEKQRTVSKLTLGPLAIVKSKAEPAVGHPLNLTQARALAEIARDQVQRGFDPTQARREQKAAAKVEAMTDNTVDAAIVEFLRRYRGRKKQGLRDSTRLLTAHYFGLKPDPEQHGAWKKTGGGVLKYWSGRPVGSIAKADAIALLDRLVDGGLGVTANRTLTNLKTFFDWCVQRDMRESSPVAVLDAPSEEISRERTLPDPEIVALWRAAMADGYPFGTMMRLLLLTGARRDEVRKAPRSEFELQGTAIPLPTGATWRGPLWALPGSRTKNGRDHLVPLSPLAVETWKSIPSIKGKVLLFTTTGETPVSGLSKAKERLHKAMLAELRKDNPDYNLEPWSPHDLRRTFYSGLQRLGFSIEIAEACVNHTGGTLRGVAKVYGRYQYLAEKTAAFDAWARHVEALVSGGPSNVVPLHGGR